MKWQEFFHPKTVLIFFIILGSFLRFYNLDWGAPYFFHPDERNIASSVDSLHAPDQMNPKFFAYGSLPTYVIYFTGIFTNIFTKPADMTDVTFEQAILISRLYSALFSIALIPIMYFLGRKLFSQTAGIIAAYLTTVSVGFIQFAHFGTYEMWLTFFSVILFYISLLTLEKGGTKNVLLLGVLSGILIGTKASSLALLPLPILAITVHYLLPFGKRRIIKSVLLTIRYTLLFLLIATFLYLASNLFVIIDFQSFRGSMEYESSLAVGTLPVFYTGEFINTIPILYQFLFVYPFLLSIPLTIIFPFALLAFIVIALRKKEVGYFFLIGFFLILFLSQSLLFVKWVRYLVPTLPFIYLMLAICCSFTLQKIRNSPLVLHSFYILLFVISLIVNLFVVSYFIATFVEPDTRVTAGQWAEKSLPHDAAIVSEVYDLGIIPFNESFSNITLYNFYELDNNSLEFNEATLRQHMEYANYLILPSQRILKTRTLHPEAFPKGSNFYKSLVSGRSGFEKIYETPCSIWCQIAYLGNPIMSYEGTATIFDRPTVLIYQKRN